MKMNEARKLNNKAVVEEQERLTDPTFEKRKNKEELFREKECTRCTYEAGSHEGKGSICLWISCVGRKGGDGGKERAGAGAFGWDVFNEDSLYSAYYKRVKKFEGQGGNPKESKEGEQDLAAKMAADVEA